MKRLVQLLDEEGNILLCETNMSDEEITECIENEEYDDANLDYEEKLELGSKEIKKDFERVFVDELYV